MTERAKQFLSQLERAPQKFVHIEVAVIREVVATVREQALEECLSAVLDGEPIGDISKLIARLRAGQQ